MNIRAKQIIEAPEVVAVAPTPIIPQIVRTDFMSGPGPT